MSVITNQRKTFLGLVAELRPHWRRDVHLPGRIRGLLARSRGFGSRDRKLYRELLYTTLRFLPWIEPQLEQDPERAAALTAWLAAESPSTAAFRGELTQGWPDCPEGATARAAILGESAGTLLPGWLETECPAAFAEAELDALHRRARLWLRLQSGDRDATARALAPLGWEVRPSPALPGAAEAVGEGDLTRSAPFLGGDFEVQDLGSQLVLAAAAPQPGERWLDACAGAGGKALQLAHMVGTAGVVEAHDIRPRALEELSRRAARAGIRNLEIVPSPDAGGYDGVLVDAPCSGTGTWRRFPHLKWVTTGSDPADQATRQRALLRRFAGQVRPGGSLVYVTCSLCRSENERVIEAFLREHPGFEPTPPERTFGFAPSDVGMSILPSRFDTDAFYLAVMRRSR